MCLNKINKNKIECFPISSENKQNEDNKSRSEQNMQFKSILDDKMKQLRLKNHITCDGCKLVYTEYHQVYFADMKFNFCSRCYTKWKNDMQK